MQSNKTPPRNILERAAPPGAFHKHPTIGQHWGKCPEATSAHRPRPTAVLFRITLLSRVRGNVLMHAQSPSIRFGPSRLL
jgi:hypothetical protein